MNLSPNERIAGVLAPLFALRTETDLGIGDIEALRQFIDWSRDLGFRLVQLLPINETGGDHSAYNAISSRAIDPTTLHLAPSSPVDLTAADFAEVTSGIDLPALRRGPVRYEVVKPLKKQLLERAFANFSARQPNDDFVAFCAAESAWLEDYTLFRVLMEWNGERETWDEWPQASMELARAWLYSLGKEERAQFEERRQFFRYLQWIAHDPMAGSEKFRTSARRRLDGRHSVWGQLLQRGRLLPIRNAFAWSGRVAPRPNRISRTTSSPRSGARTGASRSTTGRPCGRRISPGGASASGE